MFLFACIPIVLTRCFIQLILVPFLFSHLAAAMYLPEVYK